MSRTHDVVVQIPSYGHVQGLTPTERKWTLGREYGGFDYLTHCRSKRSRDIRSGVCSNASLIVNELFGWVVLLQHAK